ncbi:F-box protein [Raphanus sativus]|uniref:F-box protein At1g11270-like n=1 Tax=Raphanus sativus TaxID=3726 RepID=A0A6J0LC62_RAPSA|nr:F-box protein At1g11270-like [Raphanus sativus]KAJ4875419.1 F-box protein [Raphanus sativus]
MRSISYRIKEKRNKLIREGLEEGLEAIIWGMRKASMDGVLRDNNKTMMLKRHRGEEVLPHDVVELILEKLPVVSLVRFKCVSKRWKSTIESASFKQRQVLMITRKSRGPDILYVTWLGDEEEEEEEILEEEANIMVGSCVIRSLKFPTRNDKVCYGACDGLVCFFGNRNPSVVFNPATRWRRSFPHSRVQPRIISDARARKKRGCYTREPQLGFGKDKVRSTTYKPVWLFNSSEFGLDNVTTCEVFDFTTNAWRYVLPASPYRIIEGQKPVYFDGSLYWLTECVETKLLSFDLHTETFQVVCNAPFSHVPDPRFLLLCILDNRLCVSLKIYPTRTQVIWSLDSSNMTTTWKQMCSIDLTKTCFLDLPYFPDPALLPIAIVDETKLLLGYSCGSPLVIHDLHTNSYVFDSFPKMLDYPVCYFPSLFSN